MLVTASALVTMVVMVMIMSASTVMVVLMVVVVTASTIVIVVVRFQSPLKNEVDSGILQCMKDGVSQTVLIHIEDCRHE